jgi:high-affinity Fe2+/Pb2+ permease
VVEEENGEKLYKCRELWLRLCGLSEDLGSCVGYTMIVLMLVCGIVFDSSCFALLSAFYADDMTLATFILTALSALIYMFTIFEFAHRATRKVLSPDFNISSAVPFYDYFQFIQPEPLSLIEDSKIPAILVYFADIDLAKKTQVQLN